MYVLRVLLCVQMVVLVSSLLILVSVLFSSHTGFSLDLIYTIHAVMRSMEEHNVTLQHLNVC